MTILFSFSMFSRKSGCRETCQHPQWRSKPVLRSDFLDWYCLPAFLANPPNEVWHYWWMLRTWTVEVTFGFKWILVLWTQGTGIQQSGWYPEQVKKKPHTIKGVGFLIGYEFRIRVVHFELLKEWMVSIYHWPPFIFIFIIIIWNDTVI